MSMTRRTAKTYYKSAVALLNGLFIQWICVLEKVVAGWDGLDRDPANQPDRNSDPALVATSFHSYRYLRKLKTQEMLRKYKTNKASKTTSRDMCNFLRVTREALHFFTFHFLWQKLVKSVPSRKNSTIQCRHCVHQFIIYLMKAANPCSR